MDDNANPASTAAISMPATNSVDRQAIQAEMERRSVGQRLTPAQRRIAQCMVEHSTELGFLSSMELAALANVSQPSVTRFAVALGFDGYLEMRKFLRAGLAGDESSADSGTNRYQAAAMAEAGNFTELAQSLANKQLIDDIGQEMAASRPLAVLGVRASAGLAVHFAYFAAKVHPDVRLLQPGGSLIEDQIEQCCIAGGTLLLAFMLPLYPRESLHAIEFAREAGLRIALVTDASYSNHDQLADLLLTVRVNSKLVFDSPAGASLLATVLLDAMCGAMNGEAQRRLDSIDRSSRKRKVFVR